MADEPVGSGGEIDGGSESSESIVSDVGYNNPFDFSENKPQSVLDSLEFNLNDDGEVEISGLGEEGETEGEEQTQEVTSIEDIADEENPFAETASDPRYKSILDENAQLKERLAKIEERLSTEDQSKSKATLNQEKRAKLVAAGFMDEQIDAILEITTSPESESQKETPKESKETDEQKSLREERTNRELAEVLGTYNGKDGNPTVEDMRIHVDYIASLYGAELLKHPIPNTFKLAENSPFISYLIREYPDKMKTLSLDQVYTVSNRLKTLYYKNNPKLTNKFYHLYPENHKSAGDNGSSNTSTNEQSSTARRTDVTNNDINRLAHEKNEISRNVPGGEVETETEINERRRPKSAREVATASIMAAFGESQ